MRPVWFFNSVLNNLNLGDDNTDIETAFNRWLANIEKHERPSWVDRFVETFMMYFPPDQVHIIDGENMAHNAQEGRIRNFCFPSQVQNELLAKSNSHFYYSTRWETIVDGLFR